MKKLLFIATILYSIAGMGQTHAYRDSTGIKPYVDFKKFNKIQIATADSGNAAIGFYAYDIYGNFIKVAPPTGGLSSLGFGITGSLTVPKVDTVKIPTQFALTDSAFNKESNKLSRASAFFPGASDTLWGIGHSYMFGANASDTAHRWFTKVVVAAGGVEINLAASGRTLMYQDPKNYQGPTAMTQALSQIPTKRKTIKGLFIDIGLNDAGQTAPAYTLANYMAAWDTVLINATTTKLWRGDQIYIIGLEYIGQTGLSYYGTVTGNASPTYARMRQFDSCNRAAALKYGCNYIEMYDRQMRNDTSLISGTGSVHPNDAGYDFMAKAVLQSLSITPASSGGGSGTPAGSNTEIQFNNSGSFGSSSSLKWTTNGLGLFGASPSTNNPFVIGNGIDGPWAAYIRNINSGTGAFAAWNAYNDLNNYSIFGHSGSAYSGVAAIGADRGFLYSVAANGYAMVLAASGAKFEVYPGNSSVANFGVLANGKTRLRYDGSNYSDIYTDANGILNFAPTSTVASVPVMRTVSGTAAVQWYPSSGANDTAFSAGFSVPGNSATKDLIFSHVTSATWTEYLRLKSTGVLTLAIAPSVGSTNDSLLVRDVSTGDVKAISSARITGGGGTNYWTSSGGNIYNNTGTNVGIGTTSPASALHVLVNGGTNVPRLRLDRGTNSFTGNFGYDYYSGSTFKGGLYIDNNDVFSIYNVNVIAALQVKTDGNVVLNHTNVGTGTPNILVKLPDSTIGQMPYPSSSTESSYTPTITNGTNVNASTAYSTYYTRVGNTVTMWGKVNVDPTSTGTTVFKITVPVSSTFTNEYQATGSATADPGFTSRPFLVVSDAATGKLQFTQNSDNSAAYDVFFSITYKVL